MVTIKKTKIKFATITSFPHSAGVCKLKAYSQEIITAGVPGNNIIGPSLE